MSTITQTVIVSRGEGFVTLNFVENDERKFANSLLYYDGTLEEAFEDIASLRRSGQITVSAAEDAERKIEYFIEIEREAESMLDDYACLREVIYDRVVYWLFAGCVLFIFSFWVATQWME